MDRKVNNNPPPKSAPAVRSSTHHDNSNKKDAVMSRKSKDDDDDAADDLDVLSMEDILDVTPVNSYGDTSLSGAVNHADDNEDVQQGDQPSIG